MSHPSSIYVDSYSLITPFGWCIDDNFKQLSESKSGITIMNDNRIFNTPIHAAKIDDAFIDDSADKYKTSTRFDSILLAAVDEINSKSKIDLSGKDVIIVLSTTKGNIELLQSSSNDHRLLLSYSAHLIQQYLQNPNKPLIISNACISGVSALVVAKRLLGLGLYKHALIVGCDTLSKFVISGFISFHAISSEACKPFDKNRNGITLGEAAAAVVISSTKHSEISIEGGFISNDANHISGPSKTGEELSYCIQKSLENSHLLPTDIDFISAHGTATSYNDEMESKAFSLVTLNSNPVFSLKGAFGHTLGASGILESIISIECLKRNIILPSIGFDQMGVSGDIVINKSLVNKELKSCIKTASGFGGCNAAIIFKKH